MDDIDRKLLILLAANPRMHFREMSERLGISRQAAHHRVHALLESGVIKNMTASVSFSFLDAIPIAVFGDTKAPLLGEDLDRLGESEFTRRVVVACGNYAYVVGVLRRLSELDSYVEFVKAKAKMEDPAIGLYCLDSDGLLPNYQVDGSGKPLQIRSRLSTVDLRIISSLQDDARRPIVDVAKAVGVSTRTVRQRLHKMISDGSLEFHAGMDVPMGGDQLFLLHVWLRAGARKEEVGRRLLSSHPFRDAYVRAFSNLPRLLILVFWSDRVAEARAVLEEVRGDKDVRDVMLNFAYLERMYRTWRDDVLKSA